VKAHLLYVDRDLSLTAKLPIDVSDLRQDLGLDAIFEAMAAGDKFLREIVQRVVLLGLQGTDEIRYRQEVLRDCLTNPELIRSMYAISVEAIEAERKVWGWTMNRYPESLLHRSITVLEIFVDVLRKLRGFADGHARRFRSEGFKGLLEMLSRELSEEYLRGVIALVGALKFEGGIPVVGQLGDGNRGCGYAVREPRGGAPGLIERIQEFFGYPPQREGSYVFQLADRDESGFRALAEVRGHAVSRIAVILGQSSAHILSFLIMLRTELGFYIGCLNLHERLGARGESTTFPECSTAQEPTLVARGLYDVAMSLCSARHVVGNDVDAEHRALVVVTGANRGGKTTFLRSVGQAQIMMQCGLFVPAQVYRSDVRSAVFTHFKREEDASMKRGKLDEELSRMSALIDRMDARSIVLMNESFASTNEREGSELGRQVVRALREAGVKIFYVTHLYDLSQGLCRERSEEALFLRAERLDDGRRTFRVLPGEPMPTAYGHDLYSHIFAETPVRSATARAALA
jgi:MutS domain V